MKRALMVSLCAVLCAVNAGCGPAAASYTQVDYDLKQEELVMPIGAWWCPKAADSHYKSVADCGINFLFLDQKLGGRTSAGYTAGIELCQKYGIKFVTHSLNTAGNIREADFDPVNDRDWSVYDNFMGLKFFDEPQYKNIIEYLPTYVDAFNEKYPDSIYYANLWPMYIGTSTPSYADNTYIDKAEVPEYTVPYYEYLDAYGRNILSKLKGEKWLSVDFYPLNETLGGNKLIHTNWLYNLEMVKEAANRYGAKTHYFLQTTDQTGLAELLRREISYDMLSLQVYTLLAMGADSFSHFLYYMPNFSGNRTMLTDSGAKTAPWYAAEQINHEVLAFDHVYMQFTWQGVMPVYADDNEFQDNIHFSGIKHPLETLADVSVTSATQDLLCGYFTDAQSNNGYLITNFTDKDNEPAEGVFSSDLTLECRGYTGAIVYYHGQRLVPGESTTIDGFPAAFRFADGKLVVTGLESGQGIFVIPTVG